jgi:uncharacterized protein (DUF362 family)
MNRRSFLVGMGAAVATGLGADLACDWNEWSWRASVFVAKAATYQSNLESTVAAGLGALGLDSRWAKRKSVLLKPNLVEPSRDAPQINTHPSLVRAVAEVFRSWGARDVFVAEGPGHCRDAQLVLDQSGLGEVLAEARIEFVDLNHDEVSFVPNRLKQSSLPRLALPASLKRADLVVSLPKLKTHHWAGATLSLNADFRGRNNNQPV